MTTLTDARRRTVRRSGGQNVGRPSAAWGLPAAIFFALFALVPFVIVIWLSFTNWNGITAPQWTGFANWATMFKDPVMLQSLWLTVLLTVLGVVAQLPVSMLIGVWAAGHQKSRAVLTAIYFIPLLMSATAISIVWRNLLDPNFGLPASMHWLFGDGNLFGHQATAIGVLTFVGMWQWTPLHTLIYQGGTRAIPAVLYQAASIDGAGGVRQFFSITIPQLKNTIVTSSILMVVGGLTTFDTVLILTQGGPGYGTTTTPYYMYVKAFRSFQYGPASVMAVLLVVVATVISLIMVRLSGYDKMRSTMEGM